MISFELNGDSKIVETGIFLPNILAKQDINGFFQEFKLKIYINGKLSKRKIKLVENGWKFIKPLKLTYKDVVTYTWEIPDCEVLK